jgi:uncharacterized membrane protein
MPLDEPAVGLTLAPIRQVPLTRPFHWLLLGWRDFRSAWLPSVLHGIAVALGGLVILAITLSNWYLLPGAVSGFLLVGPIVATGLYELSRLLDIGKEPTLKDAIAAWRRGTRPLVWLGLLLVLAGTLWVLVTAVLVALFATTPITSVDSFVRQALSPGNAHLFWAWVAVGGLGASLVFAVTVVSAPLLLDRDVDMISALATSVLAVGQNPLAMALWATIIMSATALSMVTLMMGFIVVIPVIGHATWHAYRDVVDPDALPPRR